MELILALLVVVCIVNAWRIEILQQRIAWLECNTVQFREPREWVLVEKGGDHHETQP